MSESEFAQACDAINDVTHKLTHLLRSNPTARGSAIGTWAVPDVACHVSHVIEKDTDALLSRPLPDVPLSPRDVAGMTDQMLRDDAERDLLVLADRIDDRAAQFTELRGNPPIGPVSWVGGTKLAPSVVACHLLEELLVHGYDIAHTMRQPWDMNPSYAALAILGAAVPIIDASPQSWVRPQRAAQVAGRVEIRLRAHGRFVLEVDHGDLRVEHPPVPRRADAYLAADPSTLLLVMLGRKKRWQAIVTGKAIAWGRRPQALVQVLSSTSPP